MARKEDHRRRRRDRRAGRRLVRAIPRSRRGFAARASRETHPRRRRRRSRGSAPRSSRRTSTTPTLCAAHSRAPTARSASPTSGRTSRRRRRSPQARNMATRREARGRAARHLVDARGHAEAGCRSPTTGCRRCRASTRSRTSTPRARRTRSSRELGVPTTFLLTSFYWENFIYFGMGPKRGAGRQARASRCRWATRSCRASPPRTSASRAYGIFKRGREMIGKTVGIAGEHLTGAEMAAAFSEGARARRCATTTSPPEVYRGFGFPGADDLGNMFQFKRDFEEGSATRGASRAHAS